MRRAVLVILAAMASSSAGCQTMLVKQMQAAPIENRLYLHAGFKKGDYALYEAMEGRMQVRLEIADVRPGEVEVHLSWPEAPGHVGFMTNLVRRMVLTEGGEVTRAFIEDRTTGRRDPLRIAGPGDSNYIGELKEVDFKAGQPMATPAGTFQVRRVLMYGIHLDNMIVSQRVTTSLFLDPSVRFGLLRRVDVYETRLPLLRLYQQALDLAGAPLATTTLYDYLLKEVESGSRWEMTLIETG